MHAAKGGLEMSPEFFLLSTQATMAFFVSLCLSIQQLQIQMMDNAFLAQSIHNLDFMRVVSDM